MLWFHSYEVLEQEKQIYGGIISNLYLHWEVVAIEKGNKGPSGVQGVFYISNLEVIVWVSIYVKLCWDAHWKSVHFMYVGYTSVFKVFTSKQSKVP